MNKEQLKNVIEYVALNYGKPIISKDKETIMWNDDDAGALYTTDQVIEDYLLHESTHPQPTDEAIALMAEKYFNETFGKVDDRYFTYGWKKHFSEGFKSALNNKSVGLDEDDSDLWQIIESYYKDILSDDISFRERVELRKEMKGLFTITRKSPARREPQSEFNRSVDVGWIDAKDRLPENDNKKHLCLKSNGEQVIARFSNKNETYGFNFRDAWFCSGNGQQYLKRSITHWQPLPNPPQSK